MDKNTALDNALWVIGASMVQLVEVQERLRRDVLAARAAGASWAQIAGPLGTSKQAAQQKYGKNEVQENLEQMRANKEQHEKDKAETEAKYGARQAKKQTTPAPAKTETSIFLDPLETPAKARRRTEREVLASYAAEQERKNKLPDLCPECGTRWHNKDNKPRKGCTETRNDWKPDTWPEGWKDAK